MVRRGATDANTPQQNTGDAPQGASARANAAVKVGNPEGSLNDAPERPLKSPTPALLVLCPEWHWVRGTGSQCSWCCSQPVRMGRCSAQWCDTGDAMAEMSEVDIRKMVELLQAIADAVEGIEKELSKLVGRGK
jgi:hypothetical protein